MLPRPHFVQPTRCSAKGAAMPTSPPTFKLNNQLDRPCSRVQLTSPAADRPCSSQARLTSPIDSQVGALRVQHLQHAIHCHGGQQAGVLGHHLAAQGSAAQAAGPVRGLACDDCHFVRGGLKHDRRIEYLKSTWPGAFSVPASPFAVLLLQSKCPAEECGKGLSGGRDTTHCQHLQSVTRPVRFSQVMLQGASVSDGCQGAACAD